MLLVYKIPPKFQLGLYWTALKKQNLKSLKLIATTTKRPKSGKIKNQNWETDCSIKSINNKKNTYKLS